MSIVETINNHLTEELKELELELQFYSNFNGKKQVKNIKKILKEMVIIEASLVKWGRLTKTEKDERTI